MSPSPFLAVLFLSRGYTHRGGLKSGPQVFRTLFLQLLATSALCEKFSGIGVHHIAQSCKLRTTTTPSHSLTDISQCQGNMEMVESF